MTQLKPVTYIEIDIEACALSYGVAPCTASVPTTGAAKCFNCRATCQDLDNYAPETVTLRFATPAEWLARDIDVVAASIESVNYTPAVISLGETLGQRPSLQVTFRDQRHSDTGPGGDRYLSERDYNPYSQGTWWGRFRARQPYLVRRPMRWIQGLEGQALADMETRHFKVASFDGPTLDGRFTITASDTLKLADGDRAQAPLASKGSLNAAITATDLVATITPAGILASDYPVSGRIAFGGKEIVGYARDVLVGDDAHTLLLLHADGDDASTAITDASASARTISVNGNLQLDQSWKKFGTAALLFDGAGDYATVPDAADWAFGTGNFTIETWLRISSLAAQRTIASQQTDANNRQQFFVTTAGGIGFSVTSASSTIISLTSSNGVIVVNTDYHVALVRNGTALAIYVDGVSVATSTDSDSVPNYTGALTIGMVSTSTNPFIGWMDEFRVSNVARWTTGFTSPVAPYLESADQIALTRGLYGTEATDHEAGDRAQLCLEYLAQDPADVIADLFETYAGVDAAEIPLTDWLAETAAYYRRAVTALIAEPTPVKTLVNELIQQVGLAIWCDDVAEQIRLRVLRAIDTDAELYSAHAGGNIVKGTLNVAEQLDKRISQVWVFFGLRNPLEALDESANYRSGLVLPDVAAEAAYGQSAIKTLFSRWIPFGGLSIATRVANIQLGRFVTPPRKASFSLFRHGPEDPEMGGGRRLKGLPMQLADGSPDDVPIQIVSLLPRDDVWEVTAEEQLFVNLDEDDVDQHPIIIDAGSYDLNLRTLYDALYADAPVDGDVVNVTINTGVIVGSTSTSTAALIVGTWPQRSCTGNRTSGSPILTGVSVDTAGLTAGMFVRGTGIPAHAKILSVDSSSQITLDANASSGAATSTALTIDTVILTLTDSGRVEGKGGKGGDSAGVAHIDSNRDGGAGAAGGPALYSRYGINLVLNVGSGQVYSGGGGGGGTSALYGSSGGAGGGGGGSQPGSAGAIDGSASYMNIPATAGTTEAGGTATDASLFPGGFPGGHGGAPGSAGTAGYSYGGAYNGGAGGAAGNAIDGTSYIKKTGAGDIRGAEIN